MDPGDMGIKICGITRVADAVCAEEAGADAIGVVMFSDSPRSIFPECAEEIFGAVSDVATVVVTHTTSEKELAEIIALRPSAIQMSYHFPIPENYPGAVIRVIGAGDQIPDDCEWVAVDESKGAGRLYNPEFAKQVIEKARPRVMLCGGLTPANVRDAILSVRPDAVDVCSGMEISPGKKDHTLIWAFVRAARSLPASNR